jgi:hypothetical protein
LRLPGCAGAVTHADIFPLNVHSRTHESTLPRDTLPLLLTLEVLGVDRALLQSLLDLIARRSCDAVDELTQPTRAMLENLDEYCGALRASRSGTSRLLYLLFSRGPSV